MFLTSLSERLIFVRSKTCGHAGWALRPTLKMVCFEFLTLFLVPDPSQLSEPFKEDIIQRIEQNAPARRQILKITDKDSCKLSFGYVVLVFHSELGTLYGSFTGSTAILSVIS